MRKNRHTGGKTDENRHKTDSRLRHRAGDCGCGKTIADFICLGVNFIPAARFKAVCERVILGQNFLRRMLGHSLFQLTHARFDLVQVRERRAQHVVHRVVCRIDRNLGDEADLFALCKGNRAGIIIDLPPSVF